MKGFLETYGVAMFTLVLMAILIAFAGPVGNMIKTNVNTQIQNVNEIGSERVKNVGRAEEPKEAVDYVYAYLDKNQELVISSVDLQPNDTDLYDTESNFGKCELVNNGNKGQKWWSKKEQILTVRFANGVKPTTCYEWFDSHTNLIEIKNIENLYTNECTNMFAMFFNCKSLTTLDLRNFDTSKVVNMFQMFYNCRYLITLDVSKFDTNSVTNMSGMFSNCSKLTLDCSSWNVSNVTSHSHTDFNKNSPNVIPPTWTN